MLHNDTFAVAFVTAYLFLYLLLIQYEATFLVGTIMLLLSPVLIVWMVYTVLKYGKYHGPVLGDREFGYRDKEFEQYN